MATSVNLPKAGMGIDEGTIARWLKREGETVVAGETIVEVETAKAIQEVQAPVSGVLARILIREGETVPVNTDIGIIE
jgi:pyruvate/2-oxoglutarate dehydrogenase complex dihydrolipoamide acyltransferase (E2) component